MYKPYVFETEVKFEMAIKEFKLTSLHYYTRIIFFTLRKTTFYTGY